MLLAITCAADLHRATGGLFDPTIREALERSGYDATFEEVASVAQVDLGRSPGRPAPGFQCVELDVDESRIRLPDGVRIDLGGIGKGLAADLVSRGLVDRGARSVIVSLGGDMRARGDAPGDGWPVPVEHPLGETVAFTHALSTGALVSSTRAIRTWTRGDRQYHHIIDPQTGASARSAIVGVVAAATDAWWAEGLAKAVMIAGADTGPALALDANVHAWLFLDDGRTIEVES